MNSPGINGRTPKRTTRPDYPETEALKLQAEHFPLPCSLQARVMQLYGDPSSSSDADLAMDAQELIGYLRNMDYEQLGPMEGVVAQTEAIGDPASPTNEQTATLKWLGAAIEDWESRFALEEPLAAELRRLKPLLAAVAVTDPGFFTPGAHPLHQLLDTIQQHAIGWQPRLGRVGQVLEAQVREAIDSALAWFDAPATDLAAISAGMAANAAKARERASKMAKRLIEAEKGHIRIVKSRRQAALMINAALDEYPAPAGLGDFIKGPWYDSAQLVLLKFGAASAEWEKMARTTARLLESLQGPATGEQDEASRQQHLFELISQLPKDLRRWLLSLQHDGHAVDDGLELVAYFHAKVRHKEVLELKRVSPIALEKIERDERSLDQALNQLCEGQWFLLDTDNSKSLRAVLVFRMDEEQRLLFANQAGIKVLQWSFSEFARQMAQGKVTVLDTGASFSRSLARSVGLETQEALDELTGVAAQRARLREEQRQLAERQRLLLEREQAVRERAELERQRREQERIEQLQREQDEADRLRREREEVQRLLAEQAEQERQRLERERKTAEQLQQRWEDASRQHRQRLQCERQQSRPAQATDAEPLTEEADLTLPRGTWLGFRDGGRELLARLAVYDRKQNHYIFVNRYGMQVRQLNNRELLLLIARGLVDILEARSRFRDEVTRAQQQPPD